MLGGSGCAVIGACARLRRVRAPSRRVGWATNAALVAGNSQFSSPGFGISFSLKPLSHTALSPTLLPLNSTLSQRTRSNLPLSEPGFTHTHTLSLSLSPSLSLSHTLTHTTHTQHTTRLYVCMCVCVCVCVCVCAYKHTNIQTYIHTHARARSRARAHTHAHTVRFCGP